MTGFSDSKGRTQLKFYEANVEGPLFALPGGPVKAALGYEGQWLHVLQQTFAGTIAAKTVTVSNRFRKVDSITRNFLCRSSARAMRCPACAA